MINHKDYTLRIAQADEGQLAAIAIELTLEYMGLALSAMEGIEAEAVELTDNTDVENIDADEFNKNNEAFDNYIDKAKSCITQLIAGLNFEEEIANSLYDVYLYVFQKLNKAYLRLDKEALKEAQELMESLNEGFLKGQAPAKAPNTKAAGPQVYAGLTYQREGLSEHIMEDDNRGFKA